ncbi:protein mono-ADP-ribosyltransferase TIPARP-like [Oncorhynchus masou masou]|uniref:protein mono-ADP-ribosyltransferase TIPARP-like n=1 Tax=Oncorhynchus masou masou TaxID=90313 RepID=UPI0031842A69
MDKALHILQKPTDSTDKVLGGGTGIALDMSIGDREFTEQSIRLSNKIPLVKPYFKKKHGQRKLDSKCLRALQDPILTTLLSTDALVTGDGVFVPRNPLPRTAGNLCTAVVVKQARIGGPVCRKESSATGVTAMNTGDTEMVDTTAELEETEGGVTKAPVDLQRVTIDSNERRFQLKLHPRAREVAATPPTPDTPLVSPPSQGGNTMIDLFASKALRGANCLTIKDGKKTPSLQADKGEIFQDKSEEASLDLVFDLLTQLQYHTHQADSVSICVDFLQGLCVYGSDCAYHHTVLPYHWQICRSDTESWQSLADDSQDQLERLYCNPDNEQVRLKFQSRVFSLDFTTMRVCDLEFDRVRRLTTPSSPAAPPPNTNPTPNCHTVWKYYCRDNFGWREYSEPVVRLIEEASGRGLKEVRFITLQNQYILNIREGFQQNAVFGFRRQIKKRPLFLSSMVLTPHLQTLGGLSSFSPSSTVDLSLSLPLSPSSTNTPSVFPETWLPMTTSQDFLQVPVSCDDRSYRTVYTLFHKTVSETKFRILKILRVQNPFLWEKYKRKKEYMSRRLSEMDRMLSERHLFHGTSTEVVEGICKHNFDPRVSGKHATMFGQGSYFARKAVYSHNFSKRSPKGIHSMFLAKVLTGRFTVGNPSMRRPPPLSPRDPSSTCDYREQTRDNWVDPQIYVAIDKETRAKPNPLTTTVTSQPLNNPAVAPVFREPRSPPQERFNGELGTCREFLAQ